MIQLIINIFKSYISNKNTLQARLPLGQGVITRPLSLGGWTMLKNNYTKNNLNFTCFFYKIRSKGIFSFLFNKYTFLNVNAVIFLIIIFLIIIYAPKRFGHSYLNRQLYYIAQLYL